MTNIKFIEMFMDDDDNFSVEETISFKLEAFKASSMIMSELFQVMGLDEEISIDEMFAIMEKEFDKYLAHSKQQDKINKEIRDIMRKS